MKPYQLIIKFQIKDRYADSGDFNHYIGLLRKVSHLPLSDVPEIPLITENSRARRFKSAFFAAPNDTSFNTHTTKSIVGKFSANALVIFDSRDLLRIMKSSELDRTNALTASYGYDPNNDTNLFWQYSRSYAAYPLRLVSFKYLGWDAFREVRRVRSALEEVSSEKTPTPLLKAFHRVFNTEYPLPILETLYRVADVHEIPRSVSIYISPSGDISDDLKKTLSELNNKTYTTNIRFPDLERYRVTKNKLIAFVPQTLKDATSIPTISNMTIGFDQILRLSLSKEAPQIVKRFFVKVRSIERLKVFESSIGSKLINVYPSLIEKDGTTVFEIPLLTRGPLPSVVNSEKLQDGQRYLISVSVSELDGSWGEESGISATFSNGKFVDVTPIKK